MNMYYFYNKKEIYSYIEEYRKILIILIISLLLPISGGLPHPLCHPECGPSLVLLPPPPL